jgi:uncharacterized protein (TIGR02271 family)
MDRTVVAAFDTQQDAQRALEALTDAGFSRDRTHLTANSGGMDTVSSGTASTGEQTLGDKIASFFGFGDDEEIYSEAVRRGSCVLTVDAADDEEADRAEAILYRFGPVDIDQKAAEWRGAGWQPTTAGLTSRSGTVGTTSLGDDTIGTIGTTGTATAYGTGATAGTGTTGVRSDREEAVIPVTEESIQVGKREVQRGGVRIISRTVEKPVEATVSLREEHATVTRRPVDRAVTDADRAFKDQSIEVRESAEEAVVGKTARVVEEVEIGKESDVREETIRDTVRKTEVDVEQLGTQGRTVAEGDARLGTTYSGQERRRAGTTHYAGPERRNSF